MFVTTHDWIYAWEWRTAKQASKFCIFTSSCHVEVEVEDISFNKVFVREDRCADAARYSCSMKSLASLTASSWWRRGHVCSGRWLAESMWPSTTARYSLCTARCSNAAHASAAAGLWEYIIHEFIYIHTHIDITKSTQVYIDPIYKK